ncbi:MAG: class I SAM-dependent methyltransferase [Patescibacteria group bacterium]
MHPLILLLFVLFLGTMAWGALLAAPWVPTLKKQRDLLIDNLAINERSVIYDLGCGSGSILFAFSDRYPNATCIGYDVALFPLLLGSLVKMRHPKKYRNVHLRFGNFFKKTVTDADVVVAFLMKNVYDKFFAQLTRNLRPGTIVAIEAWPYDKHSPTQVITGDKLVPWYVYHL